MLTVLCKSYAAENNKERINHHKPDKIHNGVKKIRKQRNLNIEEHYKIENNHYHDCESQKPKQINPMSPHKQKKLNNKQQKPKRILSSVELTQYGKLLQSR